ncbi:hypothetical protein NKI04_34940, partial [Mesorhizobium sp. M0814]|uniref:hypothetical protein n=1 Tax=Mesorhizobium sp. M0814 TaxID=2957004 RepID=UPI00333D91B6
PSMHLAKHSRGETPNRMMAGAEASICGILKAEEAYPASTALPPRIPLESSQTAALGSSIWRKHNRLGGCWHSGIDVPRKAANGIVINCSDGDLRAPQPLSEMTRRVLVA